MAGRAKTSFSRISGSSDGIGRLRSYPLALGGLALIVAVGLSDFATDPHTEMETSGSLPDPGVTIKKTASVALPGLASAPTQGLPVAGPPVAALEAAAPITRLLQAKVRPGDTMVDLLKRNGVGNQEAHKAVEAMKDLFNLKKLQVGQTVEVGLRAKAGGKQALEQLSLRTTFDQRIVIKQDANGRFEAERKTIPTLGLTMFHYGTIADSLYLSAASAGVPDAIIVEMIRLFSFDVDFQREIRRGDGFEVYYRRRAANRGHEIENGDILYAALTLRGRPLSYFRYEEGAKGRVDYYDENGKSARRALMKTPVDGARLSSNYGRRKHPILGYTRMHKGADFAANWGTPIMAAGDGVIELSARNGGYGNYVRIRHNSTYSTAYAHLSKYGRGIRKGKRVKQGQIIGYIGATGLAKGAHLHYEVLVNGKQVNPMTLKLPEGRRKSVV